MPVGIAVAVDHGHDRDAELVGLLDGDRFLVGVDHEHDVGLAAHLLDAAQRRAPACRARGSRFSSSFLVRPTPSPVQPVLQLAQALDRLGHGLPVGQHAAQPAVVDVVLAAALGRVGDLVAGAALGADEQHAAAAGHDVAHLQRAPGAASARSGQIDDMDAVAHAEDVRLHLRVPAAGVVAEMHASFQELTHGECRQRHEFLLFRLGRRGRGPPARGAQGTPERPAGCLPDDRKPACEVAPI